MKRFASVWGTDANEGAELEPAWNALIETSHAILNEAQCPSTGLVPNWWIPSMSSSSSAGTTGCGGSHTRPAEFGAEAARTGWRVALGWL
eukprot:3359310-Prymnesium_polylepis.1